MSTIDTIIYKGSKDSTNPSLSIMFDYKFEQNGAFPSIKENNKKNGYIINPAYSITISEGKDRPYIFIPGNKYYAFTSLLDKAIKLISENLFTIFPNINKLEFEADSRVLERFQTEKALTTAGLTAVPAVWSTGTGECYPGIKISSLYGTVIIPLDDAVPIVETLKYFNPIVCSITMLRFFGKIE